MTHVILSLGSNIERDKNICFAFQKIAERFGELEMSPVYETSSVGFDGPAFLNLVLGLNSSLPVIEIRDYLRNIESEAGRVRGRKEYDSRVLDIDIVLFGDNNLRPEGFNIPRDEIEKCAYVLKPLSDLYPSLLHPISSKSFAQMWQEFDNPHNHGLKVTDLHF